MVLVAVGNDCADPLIACPLRESEEAEGSLRLSHTRFNERSYTRFSLALSLVPPFEGGGHLGEFPWPQVGSGSSPCAFAQVTTAQSATLG